jgi:uncharacterized membrane protein YjfL (UPF0719 family)
MDYLQPTLHGIVYIVISFVIFGLGKYLYDSTTPFKLDEELTSKDNQSVAVSIGGYYAGLFIILAAVLMPEITSKLAGKEKIGINNFLWDIIVFSSYSLFGVLVLLFSFKINDRFILRKFDIVKELLQDKNTGTGTVVMSSTIASALFISGIVSGDTGVDISSLTAQVALPVYISELIFGLIISFVCFILGQIFLVGFIFISEKLLPYDVHYELEEKDNLAVGISFGGVILAIGILILKGFKLLFTENIDISVIITSIFLLVIIIFLNPLVRIFVDKVLLPGSSLSKEVCEDKNSGAGLIEAIIQIGFASIIYFGL